MNFSDLTHQQADDPMRRAAVVAHALSAEDQEWLFSKMEPAELAQMQSLMAELVELGMPGDRQLLERALESVEPEVNDLPLQTDTRLGSKDKSDLDFFESLVPLHVYALVTALQDEPALLIARFLKIRSWPWRQQVLDGLPESLRRQVADLVADPLGVAASGAALESALLRTMRLRCEPYRVGSAAQTPAERPRWGVASINAWLQRLASRRGGVKS